MEATDFAPSGMVSRRPQETYMELHENESKIELELTTHLWHQPFPTCNGGDHNLQTQQHMVTPFLVQVVLVMTPCRCSVLHVHNVPVPQHPMIRISADPVVQQGGARPEMVCSVVSIVAIRCATASLSRNPTPKCFWCSVHRFLCPCNSGIACRDPSSKCLWCSVHRFLCLEQWSSVPQQWNSCPEP